MYRAIVSELNGGGGGVKGEGGVVEEAAGRVGVRGREGMDRRLKKSRQIT